MKKTIISILVLILAALGGSQVANLGGAPGNLPANMATTSTVEIGKSVEVLFATTTAVTNAAKTCAARTVTTGTSAIKWTYAGTEKSERGTTTLQNGFGFLQAASTTVAYQSSDFGCGAWVVTEASGLGSSTVTVVETRQ